jgi:hypothetical protein
MWSQSDRKPGVHVYDGQKERVPGQRHDLNKCTLQDSRVPHSKDYPMREGSPGGSDGAAMPGDQVGATNGRAPRHAPAFRPPLQLALPPGRVGT